MTIIRGKSSGQKFKQTAGKLQPISQIDEDRGTDAAVAETQLTRVESMVAPAAIERALTIYLQLQPRDRSVIVQARKILTTHVYGMVDRGEQDERRLTVSGLARLKAIERKHGIKSAHATEKSSSEA
jgi:dUTPase